LGGVSSAVGGSQARKRFLATDATRNDRAATGIEGRLFSHGWNTDETRILTLGEIVSWDNAIEE
jgi:hypothetical protein